MKLADLPPGAELFGFQLGMTAAQVKTRLPHLAFGRVDEFGVSRTTINPAFTADLDKSAFAGVRTISLEFLDSRLSSLWLGYESSYKWQTVPDFVAGISQSLHLPNAWESWKIRGSRIRCADFQMTLSLVAGGASFHLLDETAEKTIAARREAKDQEDTAAAEEGENEVNEIIGDRESKVYYSHTCRPVIEVKETNRILFKSTEEAEKAGYKAAQKCQ
ncbi:MAG TPA: hypothetical protein VHR36_08540 [Pyrinomonadaceae bacterium]|nr:hypothetical protein [Pyrinomonadaceae bacterium]